MHSSLLSQRNRHLKQLRDISHNVQNRGSGDISSPMFETYKNAVRTHACCIYNIAADMAM